MSTFENIFEMYNLVYEQMVDAGLAGNASIKEKCWTNDSGDRVKTEEEASGSNIDYDVTLSKWILFGDEV